MSSHSGGSAPRTPPSGLRPDLGGKSSENAGRASGGELGVAAEPVLFELREVEAGYGRAALVLRGLSVRVEAGTVVCLVGPNGAGKSTVLKVASGMLRPRAGSVLLRGEDVGGRRPQELLARGVAHVLQGHSVFREMTVEENVRMGGYTLGRRGRAVIAERCERVRDVFPVVGEKWRTAAGLLSGGEQKQVELARALMLEPAVILLDEPSMGLDPRTTATVFDQVARLRELGVAVLLVEQNARRALEMADVGCVLDLGRVHTSGPAPELLADPDLAALYLGSAPSRSGHSSSRPHATSSAQNDEDVVPADTTGV